MFPVRCSLEDPDTCQDYLSTPWCCPHCAANFYLTGLGRLRHQVQCQSGRPDQLQGEPRSAATQLRVCSFGLLARRYQFVSNFRHRFRL